MSTDAFICAAKKAVADFLAQYHHKPIDVADVVTVWQCKTLQNYKAILIGLTQDEFLFEATYNGCILMLTTRSKTSASEAQGHDESNAVPAYGGQN